MRRGGGAGVAPAIAVAGMLALSPAHVSSLSLEQYFFELNDRERGAYMTGFLDLFIRDSARDAGYRECVEGLGPARLNQELGALVRADPRFLGYDTMSWLLYEASRLCNQKTPRERPSPPPATADAPPAAGEPPAIASLPAEAIPAAPAPESGGRSVLVTILVALAAAGIAAGVVLVRRLRVAPAAGRGVTRRDPPRTGRSPE